MGLFTSRALVAAICGIAAAPGLCQYKAIILHSPMVPANDSFGNGIGDGFQVGSTSFYEYAHRALMWSGSAQSFVNLHPGPEYSGSFAMATAGGRQVGYVERTQPSFSRMAWLWNGSANDWVNLHRPQLLGTEALGIGGDQQVGLARPNTSATKYAVMWRGSAESMVPLHPPTGFRWSEAWGTDGIQQVGIGTLSTGLNTRPLVWTGTAASHVDLLPDGYRQGEAYGVAKGQQVGWASTPANQEAMVWFGSPGAYVSLNPGASWHSVAYATNGRMQVGWATGPGMYAPHAAVWFGTPESYLNLHEFLPPQFHGTLETSRARGIDAEGNIVGWAWDVERWGYSAVMWQVVPEPSTLAVIGAGLGLVALKARRKKTR